MKTNEKKIKKKKQQFRIRSVITVAILIFIVVSVISLCSSRSPKKTVSEFISSINSGNQEKFIELIDAEASDAFSKSYEYIPNGLKYDYDKFKSMYNKNITKLKKMSDGDKKEYESRKQSILESTFGNVKYAFFKNNDILEIKIAKLKAEKEKDYKKVTKITADIESISRSGEKTTKTYTFYTLKKGSKNYIISTGIGLDLYL